MDFTFKSFISIDESVNGSVNESLVEINKKNQKELNKKIRMLKTETPNNVWGRLEDIKNLIIDWQDEIKSTNS
jgi:hypothetical protein